MRMNTQNQNIIVLGIDMMMVGMQFVPVLAPTASEVSQIKINKDWKDLLLYRVVKGLDSDSDYGSEFFSFPHDEHSASNCDGDYIV